MRAASRKVNSVLVIDVGGTHVKVMATGQREERRILSGSKMTAADVKRLANGWLAFPPPNTTYSGSNAFLSRSK
jgi:polyphosphate glucokinase